VSFYSLTAPTHPKKKKLPLGYFQRPPAAAKKDPAPRRAGYDIRYKIGVRCGVTEEYLGWRRVVGP
jgi:hypothetical protein